MTDQNTSIDGTWAESRNRKKRGCFFWGAIISLASLLLVAITAVVTVFAFKYYMNRKIDPTVLTEPEQQKLEEKLQVLESGEVAPGTAVPDPELKANRERDRRTVVFTEKELNGWLHHNTDLGETLYIDLEKDRIVGKLVHTFDGEQEDLPVVGGRTIRVGLGVESFMDEDGKMHLVVRSLTVGGVPVPNAWMFDLKNRDVIQEFGKEFPLLERFERGIEDFEIRDGELHVVLAE